MDFTAFRMDNLWSEKIFIKEKGMHAVEQVGFNMEITLQIGTESNLLINIVIFE